MGRSIDGGGQADALLTDLSKAFDCLGNELSIAKLYAYGLIHFPCIVLIHI